MIAFRRILCPIDFSPASIKALTYAAAFASWYKAELEVLHVEPVFDAAVVRTTAAQEGESAGRTRPVSHHDVLSQIDHAISAAGAGTVNRRVFALEGRADETIVARARAQRADLVVMGTHGRSGIDRMLLGSVTEPVLRTSPCPVLTVPPAAHPMTIGPVALERILCPVDYSPSSLKALKYAMDLGRQSGGCVTVLNAIEYLDSEEDVELPQFDPCYKARTDNQLRRHELIDAARERLHAIVALEPATSGTINEVVTTGRAHKAILQHAADRGADVVVMGAQGTGGVELMLYGSNTQHVVRHAACPVMTVHA